MQRVAILGGTGFVGRHLAAHLRSEGHTVTQHGRSAFAGAEQLAQAITGADCLIMLAGANVGERWTPAHKQALYDSRLKTNALLADVLAKSTTPPKRILSASAVGFYPEAACDAPCDERCEQPGEHALGRLAAAWEAASEKLTPRPAIMRFGVVLGSDGGALSKMRLPFQLGLGGPVGSGRQCISWIHIDDLCRAVSFLIERDEIAGPINLCSPEPVSNARFGQAYANALKRPFWLPMPAVALKALYGEGAIVLLLSNAAVPRRLLDAGFRFRYADIDAAMAACVR